ncbi:MAG TPA: VTT domain-containing protein [Acidobacteriota bacterium]|nr:VTT domain-containing protein [Acidobacteriota bacterium]
MQYLLDLMRTHGSIVVLAAAFFERIGLPIPALVFLVLAGCLVAEGPVSLPASLAAAVAGAMAADTCWFYLGHWRGRSALVYFCKLSLNPDSCAWRAEDFFRTRGTAAILASKLIPGVSTLVPPLAGILRMPFWRYVLVDAAGSLLWAGVGLGVGVAFGASVLPKLASIQNALILLLLAIVVGFVVFKILYRQYLIRRYSVPKIDSDELLYRMKSGQEVMIVDLRNEDAFFGSRVKLPGALRIPPAHFDTQSHLVPKDKEIVLYCT